MPFAAKWMDLEIIILSEVRKGKTISYGMAYHVESKNMIQMNLYAKKKQTYRHREQTYGYQRGKEAQRGINLEFGIYILIPRYIEQIINKDLL